MIVWVVSLSILLCSQDNAVFSVIRSSLRGSTLATHIICCVPLQISLKSNIFCETIRQEAHLFGVSGKNGSFKNIERKK